MTAPSPRPLLMPTNAPLPTPTWDPSLNRTMLYAPPFRTMDLNAQCVAWDVFTAGHEYALHQAQDAACGCDHDQIFLQGARWAERRIQAETDALLRDQFDQIRRSDLTPYWVLSERRGDTRRAAEAYNRAVERGYAV